MSLYFILLVLKQANIVVVAIISIISRLDASVRNNKQRWNDDKCRCECKEFIDKGVCDKGSVWNCEFECDKSCDAGEYLDHENCKCRKKLVDRLVEECSENIEKTKIVEYKSVENIDVLARFTLCCFQ